MATVELERSRLHGGGGGDDGDGDGRERFVSGGGDGVTERSSAEVGDEARA